MQGADVAGKIIVEDGTIAAVGELDRAVGEIGLLGPAEPVAQGSGLQGAERLVAARGQQLDGLALVLEADAADLASGIIAVVHLGTTGVDEGADPARGVVLHLDGRLEGAVEHLGSAGSGR